MASESESGARAAWEQVDLLSFAGTPPAAPSASLPEAAPALASELDPAGINQPDPVVEPEPVVEPDPVVHSREPARIPAVAAAPASRRSTSAPSSAGR